MPFAVLPFDSSRWAFFEGEVRAEAHFDGASPAIYAPDFFHDQTAPRWLVFDRFSWMSESEVSRKLAVFEKSGGDGFPVQWSEPPKSNLIEQAYVMQKAFDSGDLEKAVPKVYSVAARRPNDLELRQGWMSLGFKNRGPCFFYALDLGEQGMVGVTPEVLFEMNPRSGSIRSMALAGTRPTQLEEQDPLLQDSKECREHQIVVNVIKQKLEFFGQPKVSETYVWNIGDLSHLRTDIEVNWSKDFDPMGVFQELVDRLHPTPALGLSSKTLDYHWLRELPGAASPGRFGAPFGVWLPEHGARVFVAIRNIQWTKSNYILGSGCGYLPESQVDKEWEELIIKRNTVKKLLGALDL